MQRHKHTFRRLALACGTLLLLALIVLWSWNTLADRIPALGKLEYVHALALVLLTGVFGVLLHRPGRGRWLRE